MVTNVCNMPGRAVLPWGYGGEETSPRVRHFFGPNLLLADGHVKYFKSTSITGDSYFSPWVSNSCPGQLNGNTYSFAIQ